MDYVCVFGAVYDFLHYCFILGTLRGHKLRAKQAGRFEETKARCCSDAVSFSP